MFENPLVLPLLLGVIVLGVFYLIVTGRNAAPADEGKDESGLPHLPVQCPKCQRWKKMPPIRREPLLDEVEAIKLSVLPIAQHHFLHEYKCRFCGHAWLEHYSA